MSVFRVQLNNDTQGNMDIDPTTGLQFTTSIQRTMRVQGPNGIFRDLADGEEFTDCNYWKQYTSDVLGDAAFIELVEDDGSIYSPVEAENTYALVFGGSSDYTISTTDTFDDKYIDIINDYGSYAKFVQIENLGISTTDQDVLIQLNNSDDAVFKLKAGNTQIFNTGDILVSKLAFQGGTVDTTLQVMLSVQSVCYS